MWTDSLLTFAVLPGPLSVELSGMPPDLTYRTGSNFEGLDSPELRVNDGVNRGEDEDVALQGNACPPWADRKG